MVTRHCFKTCFLPWRPPPVALDGRRKNDRYQDKIGAAPAVPAAGSHLQGFATRPWKVTYDHAKRFAELRAPMLALAEQSEALLQFLDRHLCGVVITHEENERLNLAGFRSSSPAGAALDDLMARYRAASIEFEPDDEERIANLRRKQ